MKKSFPIYRKRHASGNVGYRLDLGMVNGKRSFKSFASEPEARAFRQKQLVKEAKMNPVLLSDIDSVVRHEILAAVKKLKQYNATIGDAVNFYLKHARPAQAGATIEEVMVEFGSVKTKAGLSQKYITTARRFFVPFKEHFKNCAITEVASDAAEKYIYRLMCAPPARN